LLQADARHLDALAVVDDPKQGKQELQHLTAARRDAAGRPCTGFSPLAQQERTDRNVPAHPPLARHQL